MGEFKPINTQEEFDAAISERIKRERETLAKKYEGYLSPADAAEKEKTAKAAYEELKGKHDKLQKEAESHDKTVQELNAKIKGYETDSVKTRIAHEAGLPYEMASRLTGDTEEAIKKDAETLSKLVKASGSKGAPPLASREAAGGSGKGTETDAAYLALLGSLEGGE